MHICFRSIELLCMCNVKADQKEKNSTFLVARINKVTSHVDTIIYINNEIEKTEPTIILFIAKYQAVIPIIPNIAATDENIHNPKNTRREYL